MTEVTLQDLWRSLTLTVGEGASAGERGDHETGRERARLALSIAAKLHQRLGILVDMRRSGEWTAEVDRAVARARAEIPGQQALSDEAPAPAPRSRRKRA